MATLTETTAPQIIVPQPVQEKIPAASLTPRPAGENKLFNRPDVVYGDWRDDLVRDGFVVVKGAIPRERADQYAEDMFSYLENL